MEEGTGLTFLATKRLSKKVAGNHETLFHFRHLSTPLRGKPERRKGLLLRRETSMKIR